MHGNTAAVTPPKDDQVTRRESKMLDLKNAKLKVEEECDRDNLIMENTWMIAKN